MKTDYLVKKSDRTVKSLWTRIIQWIPWLHEIREIKEQISRWRKKLTGPKQNNLGSCMSAPPLAQMPMLGSLCIWKLEWRPQRSHKPMLHIRAEESSEEGAPEF